MLKFLVVALTLCLWSAADASCVPESCPKEGNGILLLAVPWNCEQYISCISGNAVIRNCGEGLYFDSQRQTCVEKEFAECKPCTPNTSEESSSVEDSDEDYMVLSLVQNLPSPVNNISQRCIDHSVTPVSCSKIIGEDKLLAHPDDCGLFYYCVNIQLAPICRDCPANLHFNPIKKVCDHPAVAGCTVNSIKAEIKSKVSELLFALNEADLPPTLNIERANIGYDAKNNISERCIANTVTPVKCPADIGDDRLMPHPDDCNLFYYCVDLTRPPLCRDCPANLHFNPIKKVCDHPEVAGCRSWSEGEKIKPKSLTRLRRTVPSVYNSTTIKCSTTIDEGEVELHPNPESCESFYICSWGIPHLTYCPKGLLFNPVLLVCDLPEDAGCTISSQISPSSSAGKPAIQIKPTSVYNSTAIKCSTTIDEGEVELHPNPESCESFYICSWGIPHLTYCPKGLLFNPVLLVCDLPEDAGCTISSQIAPSSSAGKPAIQIKPTSTFNGYATEIKCNSTSNEGEIEIHPNPDSCDSFYICSWGVAYLTYCPKGQEFNPILLVCDLPENAGCNITGTTTSFPNTTEGVTTSPDPNTTQPPIVDTTTTAPEGNSTVIKCNTTTNEGIVELHPNPYSCDSFYICSWGIPYLSYCPKGQEFNPVLLVCDLPENAGCNATSTTTSSPNATTTTSSPLFGGSALKANSTAIKCKTTTDEGDVELHPNPENCGSFYICSWGIPHLTQCPKGLEFNPVLLICDLPEDAGCSISNPTPSTSTPTPTQPDKTTASSGTTPEEIPSGIKCSTSTDEGEVELHPNPASCDSFYICSWGIPYLTACPKGLEFNPVLLVCDLPEDAGCSISNIPA